MDGSLDPAVTALRNGCRLSQQLPRRGGVHLRCPEIRMGTTKSKVHALIHRAAHAYIAGPEIHDALTVCEQLAGKGLDTTMCYWNLATDQPDRVSDFYMDILGLAPNLGTDCYLSVKAPAINFDLTSLKSILERARCAGAALHFDSMAPETADATFDLIARAHRVYPKIGCTLPGRWHRSLKDADRAVQLGLRVRVVKGEWPESIPDDVNARNGFLNVIDRLGAERASYVAVATHNPELAREALSRLRTTNTPCGLELLYGLPSEPLLKIACALDVPARMYVPYGHTRLPYRLKEMHRNPRILAWFLCDLLRGKTRAKARDYVETATLRQARSRGLHV